MDDQQQLRIEIDRHLCYGFGDCLNSAPGVFDLDGEEKAVIADQAAQTSDTILAAANDCPVEAIFIYAADSGEQLFP
jgi:ferredoxin